MNNKKKKYYIFSLDMKFLNIFSFFLLFLFIIITLIIDKNLFIYSINYTFSINRLLPTFIFIFGYMILHEILHSIAYYIYGAKYKNITYGIQLEKSIFYCLCKENIRRKNILNSLLFPLFYIGIVTFIISLIIKSPYLLILSIFNISGCSGDIITFFFILSLNKDIEFSELDDTTSFSIYTNDNLCYKKMLGINYKKVSDKIIRSDYQKIKISKLSSIILILLVILLIFI